MLQNLTFQKLSIFIKLKISGLSEHWVIGGHAGRLYEDNAAALHAFVNEHTNQTIIWITGNLELYQKLSDKGVEVCLKNTISSRIKLMLAPVLIRSHGYADLDSYIGRYVRPQGLEIHVNHCLKYIKAGQMHNPLVEKMSQRDQQKIMKKTTGFDYVLACSPQEQENFRLSMPSAYDRILLGGGAHLDQLVNPSDQKLILYFPTWREKRFNPEISLKDIMLQLTSDKQLRQWLDANDYKLVICQHINLKNMMAIDDMPSTIEFVGPDEVQDLLLTCSVLISDYSSLIMDALYLDKPVIFFPFDLEDFLKIRYLFMDYDEICFGPRASDINELVSIIVDSNWQDTAAFHQQRGLLFDKLFPHGKGGYAKRSYEKISELLRTPPSLS